MGKKDQLAKLFYKSSLLPTISRIKTVLSKDLKILAYHRILDIDNKTFQFDSELISATCDDFRWQMNYVKDNYNPISFSTFISFLQKNEKLPTNPIIITFDDGFEDNYSNAYTILKDLNVPATFFISTAYIDKPKTFWFDWLVYMLKKVKSWDDLIVSGISADFYHLNNSLKINAILTYVKSIPDTERVELIVNIEQQLKLQCGIEGFKDSRPLTWDQVNEMSAGGMEFGSHSVSHPILSKVDDANLWSEIQDSKNTIELKIDKECEVIAYPVGGYEAFDERVIEMSKKAKYKLGASYISGVNKLSNLNFFELKRLHVETDVSREMFGAMLALPEIFA